MRIGERLLCSERDIQPPEGKRPLVAVSGTAAFGLPGAIADVEDANAMSKGLIP
jgi:hypothetical protein